MRVLVVNCGSSTLKFELFAIESSPTALASERSVANGTVDRIGESAQVDFTLEGGKAFRETAPVPDHRAAVDRMLAWLDASGVRASSLEAVGHRVVHGGDRFNESTLIDDEVLAGIEAVTELAPLHNGPSLAAIRAAREAIGPSVPMVAAFDTAFHRRLPEPAAQYAIPLELAEKHHIRRYGFHGFAHRSMMERYAAITRRPVEQVKLITLQLGNGCSIAAIEHGHSVDTSMGLTPLEGLVMGTRSGDIDPSLGAFLSEREGIDIEDVENLLNKKSGLLGVSGRSSDMRELLDAEQDGDERAALAIDMFCYRARKYIGAYLAALGGADAIIFGGGIGENAPAIRSRICAGMEWCGLRLDEDRNANAKAVETQISADGARLHAYVIPVNEAIIIARDTVHCLLTRGPED